MQDLEGMTWFVVIKKLIYLTFLPLLLLFSFERTQKLETVLGSPTFHYCIKPEIISCC